MLQCPLAEKIDAFRRDPSATIKSEEFRVLQDDIAAGGLDVDASKIGDKIIIQALKETTGIQGLALPDKIDHGAMNCARIISRRKA